MNNEVNNLNTGVNGNNNNNQPMNNITNNNQNSMSNPEFNQYMNNGFNSNMGNPNMNVGAMSNNKPMSDPQQELMSNGFNSTPDYNPNMQRPMNNDSLSNNKIVKNLKNDFQVLAILSLIVSIGIFILYKEDSNIMIRFGIQIGYTLLLFWGYTMAKQEKKSAGILGIIIGILMILTVFSSIIDALLGLFLLIHSIKYKQLF